MLKGNLIVGKNQSVVVHAESLRDLIKLAESKGHSANQTDSLSLRIDLAEGEMMEETFFHGQRYGQKHSQSKPQSRFKKIPVDAPLDNT